MGVGAGAAGWGRGHYLILLFECFCSEIYFNKSK